MANQWILDKEAESIVATVAPQLLLTLNSALYMLAIPSLCSAMLGRENGTIDELNHAIKHATAVKLQKLKVIEADIMVQLKQLDVDLKMIEAADSENARRRKMVAEDWIPKFIAVTTVLAFFIYIGLVSFYPFTVPPNMEFVNLAIGWIGGIATSVISYYFGSSVGSTQKNRMMAQMQKTHDDDNSRNNHQ
jgi:hypothetical protein